MSIYKFFMIVKYFMLLFLVKPQASIELLMHVFIARYLTIFNKSLVFFRFLLPLSSMLFSNPIVNSNSIMAQR